MKRLHDLALMVLKENVFSGGFAREPEPTAAMDTPDQVDAFHSQGDDDGPMTAVYQLAALACSRLTSRGGTVVDLGCGTGRFAAFLAGLRPDIRIVGYDLSGLMVETGNASLRAAGLADRVELRHGDMTAFAGQIPRETALVNCLFAIHHLPTLDQVRQCAAQIRLAETMTKCGFLILDLVRPRHRSTAAAYPRVFMPGSPEIFQTDTSNSLLAAYEFGELRDAVDAAFGRGGARALRSRLLPLYQAYWRAGRETGNEAEHARAVHRVFSLPWSARRQFGALRLILPGFPG